MILPIIAYGTPILKKKCLEIKSNDDDLQKLVESMWETMYNANGVGLAAPQINKQIRLFLVDTTQLEDAEEDEGLGKGEGVKMAFINAEMMEETGKSWDYEEGCLSIPNIRADVSRKPNIRIKYLDTNFVEHIEEFDGINARVIQHEYDHIEGKLFVEYLKPLKKRLIKRKLDKIKKGNVSTDYKMKFPNLRLFKS